MEHLITPPKAAKHIGVSLPTVYAWLNRVHDPLPSVSVGKTGRFRRVIVNQIDPWLTAEAGRTAGE